MKKLILALASVLLLIYAVPLLACDCDTAAAITRGLPDRLHSPWPEDPQRSQGKTKAPESGPNGPKQEVQPINQGVQPQGEVKK